MFLLWVFILLNINNLDNIIVSIPIGSTTEELTINFYTLLAVLSGLIAIVVIASLTFFGGGINEIGTIQIARFTGLTFFITLIGTGLTYFVAPFRFIGPISVLFIGVVYVLNFVDNMGKDQQVNE